MTWFQRNVVTYRNPMPLYAPLRAVCISLPASTKALRLYSLDWIGKTQLTHRPFDVEIINVTIGTYLAGVFIRWCSPYLNLGRKKLDFWSKVIQALFRVSQKRQILPEGNSSPFSWTPITVWVKHPWRDLACSQEVPREPRGPGETSG